MSVPAGFYTFEGSLYRDGDYSTPFRENYDRHFREISTVSELKSTIRAGKYSWPGGYAIYFITSDGAVLSHEAVREEFRSVADSVRSKTNDGWRVIGIGCTSDDDKVPYCDHTGKPVGGCGPDYSAEERAGHDFFLTRNGHGAGFWDGDWPEESGERLTASAHSFGGVDVYPGDDGLLHFFPD